MHVPVYVCACACVLQHLQANPKPAKDRKCKEDITIVSPADVSISFQ